MFFLEITLIYKTRARTIRHVYIYIYIYIYEAVHHFSRCTYRRARGLPAPWSDYSATRLQFPSEAFPAVRAGFGEHAADSRLSFSFPSSKDR